MPVFDLHPQYGDPIELVSDYSAVDDATPLSVDDTQASTGDLTVTFDKRGRSAVWKALKGQAVQVQVTNRAARPLGKVGHASGGDATVSLSIDTVLNRLAVPRAAKPQVGTLGGVVRYWAGLCGVDASDVVVDAAIDDAAIAVPGFYDNVWLKLKQFSAAIGFEVVGRDNQLVVRAPRQVYVTIDDDLLVSSTWDVDDTTMVRTLDVTYSDPQSIAPGDRTADYSRSTVDTATADDPFAYPPTKAGYSNRLPPGWVGSVRTIS